MDEVSIVAGTIKGILEKYTDPIIKGIVNLGKDEWEKFKVDFDLVFTKYLKNSVEKYGKIKTILYRTEPKYLYDFFECPNLRKGDGSLISGNSIDNIISISNNIIIQGTGGIGKSTFLKHLFLDEISKEGWIPVFIELKDLNAISEDYSINDFLFQKLFDLGCTIKRHYIEYALRSGCFVFLLDGYDEIATEKKDVFFRKLDSFCDRFSDNIFIISSRPYSEFVEFQRFSVLELCKLSKEQALSLVSKIEYDNELKQRFMTALREKLYERHESFASNPLLLNIMLLTFDNYAEIPEKLHLFYANAFETLYSKHDATKAGFRRELKSSLSYDSFKKVFAYFCFITYYQRKFEFTYDELITVLKKISATITFDPAMYILDLVNSICVLYRDGLYYRFTHRSFQEYFSAVFLKELSDVSMNKMGTDLVKRDVFRASHDNVFSMLRDMAEQRFEQNILLPLFVEFEAECEGNKYDYYFNRVSPGIIYQHFPPTNDVRLCISCGGLQDMVEFLFSMTWYYVDRNADSDRDEENAADELKSFLISERGYTIDDKIEASQYMEDPEIYTRLKNTWVGQRFKVMSEMSDRLERKREAEALDLSCLLI